MKFRKPELLLHPLFIVSILLLLLNDFYWKYQFHNWFTGKLSDFAGLFSFSVFVLAILPKHKKEVILSIGLFFIWWKSPSSDSLIQLINDQFSLRVHRTIDYTDLPALAILPAALYIKPPLYSFSVTRPISIYIVGIVSFFSFCATSVAPRQLIYRPYKENEIYFDESFNSSLTESQVLDKLNADRETYKTDSSKYYQVFEPGQFYLRIKKQPDSNSVWIPITLNADTTLFIKKEMPVFYVLPSYILNGDTLYNLEVRIYPSHRKRKSTVITIQSFQTKQPDKYQDFYYGKLRKEYKRYFKKKFK